MANLSLPPVIGTGPSVYERWRASTLGEVTEALEQKRILELMGSIDGRRVLDLGCGDGLLTATLAEHRALAVGIDADRAMLDAAAARTVRDEQRRLRFVQGRIEQLPFRDGVFDAVVVVTVFCVVSDRTAAIHEAARVLRSGGRLVIGELGRWNAWAAKRRMKGWFGSPFWRAAHFSTASELCGLIQSVGLTVQAVRGSVFYPPLGILARSMAPVDKWIGSTTTIGAAFIAIAATKQAVQRTL